MQIYVFVCIILFNEAVTADVSFVVDIVVLEHQHGIQEGRL